MNSPTLPALPIADPTPSFLLRQARSSVLRALLALLALTGELRAQAPVGDSEAQKLALLYNTAIAHFNAQKWAEAAAGLKEFLSLVPQDKLGTLGGAFYTLGAAYFNAPDYPKAIEVFKQYLSNFPNGDRVLDVKLGIAQATMLSKDYPEAIKAYQAIESIPALRDRALIAQALAYKEMQKPDLQIGTLEKLIRPEIKSSVQATGAVLLTELYAGKKQPEKAVALLGKLQRKTELIENLVSLNAVAVRLGDGFMDARNYAEAIAAYRAVRSREEVIKFQSNRVTMLELRIDANLKAAVGNPQALAQAQMTNFELKEKIADQKTLLVEFEKLSDFAPTLLFRMARAWYEWEKRWEAIVVFHRILTQHPDAKQEREPALYGTVLAYADLLQAKRAQTYCEQYLQEFPEGPNNGTVGYLAGAVSMQAGDFAGAESFFGIMIDKVKDPASKEEILYLLGNARFQQGKFEEAIKDYERYQTAHPTGVNYEDVTYRIAAAQVFLGHYEKALRLLKDYLAKFSRGLYLADAKYRTAVCYFAASEHDTVIEKCLAFQTEHPADPITGEVLSLLGDAYAAKNQLEEAVKAYQGSVKAASIDEVINYSLFEAAKHMQKLGQWEEVAAMFAKFVEERPDHPTVVAAMYWIAKARAKLGQVEVAKRIMAENLAKYIAEPKREAVEQLLGQLAQVVLRKPKSAPADAPPPAYDPVAELDKVLKPLEEGVNATARARILYARAELAKLRKKDNEVADLYREIANRFQPEDFSPALLGFVGDYFVGRGENDRATACFVRLRDDFRRSDYLDFAYVGLGEIEMAAKRYDKALENFTDALEKPTGSMKMKEATLGKAKALLELGRYDEARKLFEQVASIREWRGDATAYSVYSLGEIEARQGKWPEAIAHYRRVFVAYQKYTGWVAKSYLRAAEGFEKMGKRQDAIDNLKEMLRNEKLESLPETQEAKTKLSQWGVTLG